MTDIEAPKQELKRIPGFSQGVRPNSSARRIILNAPICPFSQQEYVKDSFGRQVVKQRRPGEVNCQLAGGQWWVACQELGHDPYFTHKKSYTVEDIYEDRDGRSIKTGEERIIHEDTYPNLVSVFVNRRINNGRGVEDSMAKKGRRRLTAAGYYETCQYRNCQELPNPKYHSIPFGDYCSREHFESSVANEKGVLVPIRHSKFNAGGEQHVDTKRQTLIAQAMLGADD